MPPPNPIDPRKYNPYDMCIQKAQLICQERGIKEIQPEKAVKLEQRCTALAGKSLTWDIPVEQVSSLVDDLCPPNSGSGKGGGMMPVKIQGSDPGTVPSGSSAYVAVDVDRGVFETFASGVSKLWKPSPVLPALQGNLSAQILKIYGTSPVITLTGIPFLKLDVSALSLQGALNFLLAPVFTLPTLPKVVPTPVPVPMP
ncbi:MAG: hypothetical protein U1F57_07810 [bacterium]